MHKLRHFGGHTRSDIFLAKKTNFAHYVVGENLMLINESVSWLIQGNKKEKLTLQVFQ